MNKTQHSKPELLAPAGSPEALNAAVAAGADAVYFGARRFNARENASNFNGEEIVAAIEKCRFFGVAAYITMNTQLLGKELDEALREAEFLIEHGASAIIAADFGFASELHRRFPEFPLHASTQACGESVASARALGEMGFCRMVAPRESSLEDLKLLCASGLEIEAFVHGAICISRSGRCLMSYVMGGRSGNRGKCAQPCRKEYFSERGAGGFFLSPADNCLAAHIGELAEAGVKSLKIEGRMKSPDYVYKTTKIYRELLDSGRKAAKSDIGALSEIFSRSGAATPGVNRGGDGGSGFTDAYLRGSALSLSLGVRSEGDKAKTVEAKAEKFTLPPVEIEMKAEFPAGKPSHISASLCRDATLNAEASGEIPLAATGAPLTLEYLTRQLGKTGAAGFCVSELSISLGENLFLPSSAVNALRRAATDGLRERLLKPALYSRKALEEGEKSGQSAPGKDDGTEAKSVGLTIEKPMAMFYDVNAIPDSAMDYFSHIFVPLRDFSAEKQKRIRALCPALPEALRAGEEKALAERLKAAAALGAKVALVNTVGQAELAREAGLSPLGSIGLNIMNASCAAALSPLLCAAVASPEPGAQIGISPSSAPLPLYLFTYGRLPVMTLEKCLLKTLYGEKFCSVCATRGTGKLLDGRGTEFPALALEHHRTLLLNSVPLWCADSALPTGFGGFMLFTTETRERADEVIRAYINKQSPATCKIKNGGFRRLRIPEDF